MKKNLLIAVAALFVAVGADAQKVAMKSELVGSKFDKNAVMASEKYEKAPVSKKIVKRAAALNDIFGTFCATQLAADNETYESFSVTFEAANETVNEVACNVKISDFGMEGTTCYGVYNEEEGTLRIPNQIIWADASLEALGYSSTTATYGPLEILNVDADDQVTTGDIVLIEDDGKFYFDDTETSLYYIYADGLDSGWDYGSDVTIAPYNGVMSFSTTATKFQTQAPKEGSSWGYGEMDINYEDWGSSVQINGFLGSGCITIGYGENNTASIATGQRLSSTNYGTSDAPAYMVITGVILNEEEGTISIDENGTVQQISGDVIKDVEIDGRPADVIRFYGVDENNYYTYNEYFIPLDENQKYWMGGYFCALDFILFKDGASGINAITTANNTNKTSKIFNLAGQQVGKNYKGIVVENGVKKIQK